MLNTTWSPFFQQMILSRVALLLTLVASIHGLTLPKDGDDLAILTGDRREHRRNHPAEAPPPTTTTTPKPYADCTFSSALFIACIFIPCFSSKENQWYRFAWLRGVNDTAVLDSAVSMIPLCLTLRCQWYRGFFTLPQNKQYSKTAVPDNQGPR